MLGVPRLHFLIGAASLAAMLTAAPARSAALTHAAAAAHSAALTHAAAAAHSATPPVNFAEDLRPVFQAACSQCHGADQQSANLRLDSRASVLKPGGVVVPGKSSESRLVRRLLGLDGKPRMPLTGNPLTPEQIRTVKAWIDGGAVWPAYGQKHWAYVPVSTPEIPAVRDTKWVRNPIDSFVLSRLESEKLHPSPEAAKEVLLRRVYLDLVGVPPSVQEIDAYLADHRPDAYERVVDRLLASPHYGERWAQPWLDLARYADTNGYEKDSRRSIWPYRDWVIKALNEDMPYDQFTIKQIAGDMLPNATLDDKIASGFNRNTMYNDEGGVDRGEQTWLTLVDRVGTTASVWLGTTLACAECHNHKYDPFTQKEFYQFLAFFDNSNEPEMKAPTAEQQAKQKAIQAEIDTLEAIQKTQPPPAAATVAAKGTSLAAAIRTAAVSAPATTTAGPVSTTFTARIAELKKELGAIAAPTTLVLEEKPGTDHPTTYIHIKGSYLNKGALVSADAPAVLNPWPAGKPRNRLGLAYWLADPANPLVARVEVNRLWEQYFGRGIVETSEDFGTQGTPPTNQPLLDWLASELVRQHWSLKAIHRLIVTSATYRQSSKIPPELLERDPYNKLLARGPRFRMEAEMLRDAALSSAGMLSLKMGGPSVFPYQPDGIWNIPYNGDTWQMSPGSDRYRRGIYTFWRRTSPYPSFVSFDAPSREFCTVRRIRTNTPLQALTTLNDPAFFEAARGLARRMRAQGGTDVRSQISYGFRLCVARRPTRQEGDRLAALYQQEFKRYSSDAKAAAALASSPPTQPDAAALAATVVVANVMMNMDETLTKE